MNFKVDNIITTVVIRPLDDRTYWIRCRDLVSFKSRKFISIDKRRRIEYYAVRIYFTSEVNNKKPTNWLGKAKRAQLNF